MEVIDARGALALYYNYPKTLEHHMGARLLLKWKWHYFAKFNFWYAIFEHPETKKVSWLGGLCWTMTYNCYILVILYFVSRSVLAIMTFKKKRLNQMIWLHFIKT